MITWVIADRQEGKTTKILEWATSGPADELRVIVVDNDTRKLALHNDYVRGRYPTAGPGLERWQIVTIRDCTNAELNNRLRGRFDSANRHLVLGLDDADLALAHLLNVRLEFATATGRLYPTTEGAR